MRIKPALIVTVFNEAQDIELLLSSILTQHLAPTEVAIVDGGSTDGTVDLIKTFLELGNNQSAIEQQGVWQISNHGTVFKVTTKLGNRSVGRNSAMRLVGAKWVAITDAGCLLHKNWLRELAKKAESDQKLEVIAGYYQADPLTGFEEAVVPFALVMPDQIDANHFLPATRSMMIKKAVFEQIGGFDERLNDNEDYALARKLETAGRVRGFTAEALVAWIPPTNLKKFTTMIYRFARGDAFSGIFRPKVFTIYLRYLFLAWFFSLSWRLGLSATLIYLYWAYAKNRRYTPRGKQFLPLLQVVADGAVMGGSLVGLGQRVFRQGPGK